MKGGRWETGKLKCVGDAVYVRRLAILQSFGPAQGERTSNDAPHESEMRDATERIGQTLKPAHRSVAETGCHCNRFITGSSSDPVLDQDLPWPLAWRTRTKRATDFSRKKAGKCIIS